MCGRYHVDESVFQEIQTIWGPSEIEVNPQRRGKSAKDAGKISSLCGDIYPGQDALVITGKKSGPALSKMRWGFRQNQKKGLIINARAETAAEKRMFSDCIRSRRCMIPASCFYEWDKDKNKATFSSKGKILYMAGFYDCFENEDLFVILTTNANESVRPVHERMPLILGQNEVEQWLYDDSFLKSALGKIPESLQKTQEYEQQSLF